MKRTIEINDTLEECVQEAIDSVQEELVNYLEENPDTDEVPDLFSDLDYDGTIHEAIDSSVPIQPKEIDAIMYLYGNDIELAFEESGRGEKKDDGFPNSWKVAAIYCYIEQCVNGWYNDNAERTFHEIHDKGQTKKERLLQAFHKLEPVKVNNANKETPIENKDSAV